MTQIVIIGAGLSGRLLALNLLLRAPATVDILMIDRRPADDVGPAYSDEAEHLLLNVPTGRMGAFSRNPAHFLEWAKENGKDTHEWSFLPRKLYRRYVLDLLDKAQQGRVEGPHLAYVRGEVIDVESDGDTATVHLQSGDSYAVDKAVLALGNLPPRDPAIPNPSAFSSRRYVRNPWAPGVLRSIRSTDRVFLIGTGQTTVDFAVGLARHGHEGRVVAISRRGLLPLVHAGFEAYPSFVHEIEDPGRLRTLFSAVRRHLERAESRGVDKRAVIDSLRPFTQELWYRLPEREKRRFLRHVFRHWEIIRSRIPPESEAVIDAMRASRQLEILAGRIADLVETDSGLQVHYLPRGSTTMRIEKADVVINCIGPETDYTKADQRLVRNLLARALIRPGPAALGIDALPDGAIIDGEGAPSSRLYTIGSPMKGVLWEVLAVPEIRVQAERLADLLISTTLGDNPGQYPSGKPYPSTPAKNRFERPVRR